VEHRVLDDVASVQLQGPVCIEAGRVRAIAVLALGGLVLGIPFLYQGVVHRALVVLRAPVLGGTSPHGAASMRNFAICRDRIAPEDPTPLPRGERLLLLGPKRSWGRRVWGDHIAFARAG